MDIRVIIGKNIQFFLRERSLSQEELSFRSDSSRAYISGLEAGRRNPTALSLVKFAEALGVTVVELITDHDADRKTKKSIKASE
ncbi:helix-turn-helix domain-containing protein [Ensifer canadensis]|uniref:helix-turn-helix domain-containing protein n=1 Tax=Ensifer canadensis TaxID=555315 RepID=UPI0035E3D3A8